LSKISNYVLSLKTLKKLVEEREYDQIKQEVFNSMATNTEYANDITETIREIYKQPLQKLYVSKVTIDGNLFKLEFIKVFDDKMQEIVI